MKTPTLLLTAAAGFVGYRLLMGALARDTAYQGREVTIPGARLQYRDAVKKTARKTGGGSNWTWIVVRNTMKEPGQFRQTSLGQGAWEPYGTAGFKPLLTEGPVAPGDVRRVQIQVGGSIPV